MASMLDFLNTRLLKKRALYCIKFTIVTKYSVMGLCANYFGGKSEDKKVSLSFESWKLVKYKLTTGPFVEKNAENVLPTLNSWSGHRAQHHSVVPLAKYMWNQMMPYQLNNLEWQKYFSWVFFNMVRIQNNKF